MNIMQQSLQDIILDQNDGPVTVFVAIHRACELVKQPNTKAEDIANALYESIQVLSNYPGHTLPTNEFPAARAL